MAGLGLMNRRRGLQASPTIADVGVNSYIQDSALVILDGIDKGGKDGRWINLVADTEFFETKGAVSVDKGWQFNGSSYMESSNFPYHSWKNATPRTFEIVATFERKNETELLLMGKEGAMAFGSLASQGAFIISAANVNMPMVKNEIEIGKNAFAIVGNATSSTANISLVLFNGENVSASSILSTQNNWSAQQHIAYLGKRSSGNFFKGTIHAIRIHNRGLSLEELRFNYEIDKKRFGL